MLFQMQSFFIIIYLLLLLRIICKRVIALHYKLGSPLVILIVTSGKDVLCVCRDSS